MKKIIIIGLIITVLLLCGCTEVKTDTGVLEKKGIVIKIEYDTVFGGTFTDWRDDVYFDDGTVIWVQGGDLSIIEYNKTGIYRFRKNYFEYEGVDYEFHKFIGVEYLER